ncbi:MAG: malectin domain-containing carbohydrate-binding protein [Pseudomonadota bacterium]
MPISFTEAGVFSGADGGPNILNNPTSLQFGPDGRLYVTEQNGSVNAFTVELQGDTWVATDAEELVDANGDGLVKNIQNHNDDGSVNNVEDNRQVTGILTAGTADEPILYISSSDPQIASNGEKNLDTNSGVVTRASFNSTTGEWEVVDLVRGLPRSEENHAVNGMILGEDGTTLLLQVGGFTNNGAPSGFFSYTNEYVLSGSVLELDLAALDALPTLTDPNGGQDGTSRDYKYDLPTLDDPNRTNAPVGLSDADAIAQGFLEDSDGMDLVGPWGGNDGLNMAILPADAPLRIFADGMRNAYDLARTPDGKIYTVDNGSNGGLGGAPAVEGQVFAGPDGQLGTADDIVAPDDGDGIAGEALAIPGVGSFGEGEPLQQIVEGGYYYHANPVRSNQNQSWTVYNDSGNEDTSLATSFVPDISALVPIGVNIADGFLIDPSKFAGLEGLDPNDVDDRAIIDARLFLSGVTIDSDALEQNDPDGDGPGQQAIEILGSSTNGILAYDSGGAAFGGTIDGKLFVTQFNDNITLLNINDAGTDLEPIFEEGPDGIFGTADDVVQDADGVLFVANTTLGVPLVNPLDVTQGPGGTLWVAEIGSNEITVLAPSNVIDPFNDDSDFDGILNVDDPFIRDASNGTLVTITPDAPTVWEFSQDAGDVTPGPDGFGGGLTGVMINGTTDFEEFFQSPLDPGDPNNSQIQLDNVKFVTAAGGGTTTIEQVSNGDPFENGNNGEFLFHTGFTLGATVETFTVTWVVKNPAATSLGNDITDSFQQIGGYIGDGTQSNYLKIVAIETANGGGTRNIQIALEDNDGISQSINLPANDVFNEAVLVQDSNIVFELEIDPTAGTAVPKATYTTTSGDVEITGGPTDVIDLTGSAVLNTIQGNNTVEGQTTGIATGLFATNNGSSNDTFQAVFDSITVTATEAEVAPVAGDDSFFTQPNNSLTISVADLLANDTDANASDTLVVTGVSGDANATVTLDDNGTAGDTSDDFVTFTPVTDFTGTSVFSYTVTDGTLTDTADVSVDVSDLSVLFRVNAGTATIAASANDPYNSTLDWIGTGAAGAQSGTQSGLDFSVNTGNLSVHDIAGRDASVADYVPQELFAQERWDPDSGAEMQYSFGGGDLAVGTYTANIFAGNGFGGTSAPGQRVFDILVEDELVFDDVDLAALFGHQTGGLLTWTGEVTDGTLDIEWVRDGVNSVENPTVNGIEILAGAVGEAPLSVSIVSGDQTVGEDDGSAFISILTNRTVPNDESVTFTYVIEGVTATPEADYSPNESLTGAGTATFTGTATIAGGSSDFQIPIDILQDTDIEPNETFTVEITSVSANASLGSVTQATVTIQDDDVVVTPGEAVVRINAGGAEVAANDGGIVWSADQTAVDTNGSAAIGTPSEFLRAGSDVATYGDNTPTGPGTNATGAPDALFTTERFWPGTADDAFGYDFDLENGDYVVNLYFDELFFGAAGARVFDVALEGDIVLDDFDPFVAAGSSNDTSKQSFAVSLTDGELNLDFIVGSVNNPNIAAIEILEVDSNTGPAVISIAAPDPASVVEDGDIGNTSLDFAVSFDTTPSEAVTIEYSVEINGVLTPGLTQVLGTADGTITVDVPNDDANDGAEAVTVTLTGVSVGGASAVLGTAVAASATVTEDDSDTPAAQVLYRVNAGGPELAAIDGGPAWTADLGTFGAANNSPYLFSAPTVNTIFNNSSANSYAGDVETTIGVPSSTPLALFDTERGDRGIEAPTIAYQFDVGTDFGLVEGDEVEVRLYVAEIFNGVDAAGERVFDVEVDGVVPTEFDDIDPFADGGNAGNVGTVRTYIATVDADGILDLNFLNGVENPAIKAIEILTVESGTLPTVSVGDPVPASIEETGDTGVTTLVFPVTFSEAPSEAVTVSYEVDINGTVTAASLVLGTSDGVISVDVPNDDASNGTENVTVTLTGITVGDAAAELGTTVASGAVTEDDGTTIDSFNGTPAVGNDFSNDSANPDDVTLLLGSNTLVSNGGGGDSDFITFEVAAGQRLTQINLTGVVDGVGGGEGVFLGIQLSDSFPALGDIVSGAESIDGGTVFSSAQAGTDLLPLLASTEVENVNPGQEQTTTGFALPLGPGQYTLWFNQNQSDTESTIELVTEEIPPAPTGDVYLANQDGNFVIEAEDARESEGGSGLNGWEFQTEHDLDGPGEIDENHEAFTGDGFLEWDGGQFFNDPSNGNLKYKIFVETTGTYYLNVRSSIEIEATGGANPFTEHNDSFGRMTDENGDPLEMLPGFKGGEVVDPTFTGENGNFNDGWHKNFQSGGPFNDWKWSNKNVDNTGIPIAYELEAGNTYHIEIAARSNNYAIDRIHLELIENPPGEGQVTNPVTPDENAPLSPLAVAGAEISGRVFADANGDAVDNGEPGIADVTVELLDDGGSVVDTVLTGIDGSYTFENLADGTYSVRFPTDLEGDALVAADQGGDDDVDSDANAATGETPAFAVVAGDVIDNVDAGYDREITLVGEAVLTVNDGANDIEISNFGAGSFQISNTGEKNITAIEIDVTDALFPDAVFDPFGLAGDLNAKILEINTEGGTGVITPAGGFDEDAIGITYIGAGGTAGYEKIRLTFNDFNPGETLGFSVDMDPNSVAGAAKGTLDSGAPLAGAGNWDVGGISGAELIGSSFIVEYDDASTSIGKLHGQGTGEQSGATALSTQSGESLDVTLTVNGLIPGAEGTYGTGGPQILISGPAGEIARVLVSKGFIVPFTNNFAVSDPYAATLDAQIAVLEASGFPANNAVEMLYVDVPLTGALQDISGLFDFSQVAGFDLSVPDQTNDYGILEEDKLPLAIVASVVDPATDIPKGEVTSPIHLVHSDTVSDIVLSPIVAEIVESGDTATFTQIDISAAVLAGAEGTYEAVLTVDGVEVAVQSVTLAEGANTFSLQVPNDNVDDGVDIASVTLREVGGGAAVPAVAAVFSITEDDGPIEGATLLRINAFGPELAALDAGPVWQADTVAAPIEYFSSGDGSAPFNRGDTIAAGDLQLDPALPGYVPSELFELTRSSDAAINYDISLADLGAAGDIGSYKVNLYFAESAFGPGGRVFDILTEGEVAFDNFDPSAAFGVDTGGFITTTVDVTDGELNLSFLTGPESGGVQNPIVSGIEIIELIEQIDPEADLSLTKVVSDDNPDFGDIITFTVTVTNDGPDAATGVEVEELLGNGFALVSTDPSVGSFENGVWTLGELASGESATLTVDAEVLQSPPTPDEVVYRINPGADSVIVVGEVDSIDDSEPDFPNDVPNASLNGNATTPPGMKQFAPGVTLTGGQEFGNENGSPTIDLSLLPADTVLTNEVLETERFGVPIRTNTEIFPEQPKMEWDFVVDNGDYQVRLYFAELFATASGQRIFDVEVEGDLVLDDYDIFADVGQNTAVLKSFNTTVIDGNLDVDFTTVVDNAKISAIEIIKLGSPGEALDYTNSAQVLAAGTDDPNSTAGNGVIGEDDDATVTVGPVAGGINDVTIIATDPMGAEGEPTDPAVFTVSLEEAAATDTVVTYTVGGTATADADYVALTGSVTITAGDVSADIDVAVLDDLSVDSDEDIIVTLTGVTGDANVALGSPVEATVVIADDDVANLVSIEVLENAAEPEVPGQFQISLTEIATTDTVVTYTVGGTATVDEDYVALTGSATILAGETAAAIDVTVIDDLDLEGDETIVVTLDAVTAGDENVLLDETPTASMDLVDNELPPVPGSALIEITPDAALGASTFGGSSFQITNTGALGDANIVSISIDLSTAILPDMVFDPVGAGGDALASCFTPNSGGTATGLVVPVDPCVDPFSDPRNGGFDTITVDFTDFNPGESFFFTADIDPNNIQGVPGAGNAGGVSGYELIGSTVSITFDDGTFQEVATTSLFEDGSLGGGQAIAQTVFSTTTVLPAPVIELVGPGVDTSTGLLGDQIFVPEGETVQTVKITGVPSAFFSLLQMDARLFIASGEDPFDVQPDEAPFYANEAMAGQAIFNGQLDENGEALVPVTLLETLGAGETPDGGLNHFVAVLSDTPYAVDQAVSQTSNTLVVTEAPEVEISVVALADGAEPETNGQFEVTLAEASAVDTVVSYEINAASTATADSDYVALSGSVTILAGETSALIDVTVLDDVEAEDPETVTVDLLEVVQSNGVAVLGAQTSATVSITSEDIAEADLSVSKTVSDTTPAFGDTVTFLIEVTNAGPGDAGGITVEDLMGDGFEFSAATLSAGTFDDLTGLWTLGELASGETATLSIEAEVLEAQPIPDEVIYRVNPGGDQTFIVGVEDSIEASNPDWLIDPTPNSLNGNATTAPGTSVYAPGITRTGGNEFGNENGAPVIDLSLLPGDTAAIASLFETERFGVPLRENTEIFPEQPKMEWDFELDNGDYTVNLYFAEILATTVGAREFDVEVEGALVLDDYDIFADVGGNKAVLKSFDATVADGNLDIDFTSVTDNAKISAIEIIKKGVAAVPFDYSTTVEILTSDAIDPDSTLGNGVLGEDDDASLTLTPSTEGVNEDPVATDDVVTTPEDVAVEIDVLANDTDSNEDILFVESVTDGTNGTVAITAGGVTYTPDEEFSGEDTFIYTVSDGNGGTDTATVTVTVDLINDTPIANDDTVTGDEDTIIPGDVSTNDSDAEEDVLLYELLDDALSGSVLFNGDGTFDYVPDPDFSGSDSFTYTVSDGNSSDTATVFITVNPDDDLVGDSGDNTIETTSDNDIVYAGAGNDTIISSEGADQIYGGDDLDVVDYVGSDDGVIVRLDGSANSGGDAEGDQLFDVENIFGSNFDDTLVGDGEGNTINGNGGSDSILGSSDDDVLGGGLGGDRVRGNAGEDTIEGNEGNDRIFGDEDEDMLFGGANNDRIFGGGDNDTIEGGSGDDELFGTLGADLIYGGEDDDFIAGNDGSDMLFGGTGNDTVNGNEFGDELYGGEDDDILNGGSGIDVLFGGDGADTLNGGSGSDRLTGGADADTFQFTVTGGIDRITDWEDGVDVLDFTADGFGFGDFAVSEFGGGAGTKLVGHGYVVFLEGIATTDVDNTDFL